MMVALQHHEQLPLFGWALIGFAALGVLACLWIAADLIRGMIDREDL